MAQLAIYGNSIRGNEVIALLEMLGGKNIHNLTGTKEKWYILSNGIIEHSTYIFEEKGFTLEQFLEKFPYKVGDRVKTIYEKIGIVSKPIWSNRDNCIRYELEADTDSFYFVNELQPYKEETTDEDMNYCKTGKITTVIFQEQNYEDKVELDLGDNYEIKVEDDKTYVVRKKPQYPKTYDECCKILMGKTNFQDFSLVLTRLSTNINEENSISPEPPLITLINNFYKLLICRDAYWKIVGEQMGLGKPWEPDWGGFSEGSYSTITKCNDRIVKTSIYTHDCIFAFPTEEMRDAFYENFKELIENVKELL